MLKKILSFIFVLTLMNVVTPYTLQARALVELIDEDFQPISVSVIGNVLRVEGANDEMLHIYNVTGVRVMSVKVDSYDKRYTLSLPKGCYIVKVGKVVRKIFIR